MTGKGTPPSITETAFDCPYCGAFTTQNWCNLHATSRVGKDRNPKLPTLEYKQTVMADQALPGEVRTKLLAWVEKMLSGFVFLEPTTDSEYGRPLVCNLFLSRCYNCEKIAVWVHDRLVYPTVMTGPPPNADLPPDVLRDYEEAGRILSESPRGAAALLRLAIQKLCVVLGEKGNRIDDDIASLVKKGLLPMVQQALDAVRVIGNEAVHPGTLELKDDRDTAMKLFGLVNIIAEQMISNPKHTKDLYDKLPTSKRTAIENRDKK